MKINKRIYWAIYKYKRFELAVVRNICVAIISSTFAVRSIHSAFANFDLNDANKIARIKIINAHRLCKNRLK